MEQSPAAKSTASEERTPSSQQKLRREATDEMGATGSHPSKGSVSSAGGGAGVDSLQDLLDGRGPPVGSRASRNSTSEGGRRGRARGREDSAGQLDFDEEARKLWARLNLDPSSMRNEGYNALDPLWRHPETGGTFFVGNQTAAANLNLLQQHKITHVVNCTDNMPLYHEGSGKIKYFRFDITSFYRKVRTDEDAVTFAQPMLDFVGAALADGKNVMAHCLAGAHRAGTTGCICLMHFAQLSNREAVPIAKRCRPIIDPIGDFPELLAKLDRGWKNRKGLPR